MVLLAAAGCRHPIQAYTTAKVTTHPSPVEDRGPLTAMTVGSPQFENPSAEKIAIVDVDGILLNAPLMGLTSLGENPVSLFREKLDCIAVDSCFTAVVVRINSPGGGVTASDIMWRDLCEFKARTGKPVVACLMDVGAGGGYYIATAADLIVAHPTTVTGGMGVILNLYNLQDTMMQFNIFGTPIKAGKNIDLGTPIEPADDQARAILQEVADQYHERVREVVRQGRPRHDPEALEDFDGRIFTARDALARQLIDQIGYLDEAVAAARQLGGSPGAKAVILHRANDPARTPYAVTANVPVQGSILPLSIPGLERTQLPTFLYLWQPEPTYERRASGR
jgi:protease-4